MGTRDKRVDAYIKRSADFAKPVLMHLRELVHQACPDAHETIKWGFPHFEYHGILCSMASFKKHCVFGFWKAKLMASYTKELQPIGETAMGHLGKITSLKDLPSDAKLRKYIKEAARLNETGARIERGTAAATKKRLSVPSDFRKALSQNPKAKTAFDAFSHSQKKDYIDWVTGAKTEMTRNKRMATSIEWLAAGKGRNWKYER
ncbi:MAG: YdeI/OmpD-associated family protein [Cyclobacteriaceae bacterium]|nr:YdeI/OmpD-associated family protein [Cyclobacteriaceae bacterium]